MSEILRVLERGHQGHAPTLLVECARCKRRYRTCAWYKETLERESCAACREDPWKCRRANETRKRAREAKEVGA